MLAGHIHVVGRRKATVFDEDFAQAQITEGVLYLARGVGRVGQIIGMGDPIGHVHLVAVLIHQVGALVVVHLGVVPLVDAKHLVAVVVLGDPVAGRSVLVTHPLVVL